jgi:hypothetical protein
MGYAGRRKMDNFIAARRSRLRETSVLAGADRRKSEREMDVDADLRAYDALSQHPRLTDLAAATRAVMTKFAGERRAEHRPERVAELAIEFRLAREEAGTPFGNALDVLERGPEDVAERALARALSAHAIAYRPPKGRDEEDQAAADLLWLATRTPFDATGLLDLALGQAAIPLWDAIAEQIRRIEQGARPSLGRGEALVAAAALASSTSLAAAKLAAFLATDVRDRQLARILGAGTTGNPEDGVRGEMAAGPRGSFAAALLAMTGISLAAHVTRLFARVALNYKRPAEIVLSNDGGIRVRWRTELLGRTLNEEDVVVPRSGLVRASRNVRYPAIALYAGLLALALGSCVGMSAFVDGLRASSPSLLATGMAIVIIGIAIDFAFSSIAPGRRGKCRILLVPRSGAPLCIGDVDIAIADALLARLARR